jgi:hypothetical protein
MTVELIPDQRLRDTLGALGDGARGEVAHAAAYALYVAVRRHVARLARSRHGTAESLGAAPTGFLQKGARAIVCRGDCVDIPIPGFARVFRPLDIRPRRAKELTIPISRVSYGVRAGRLAREGWSLFRVAARGGRGAVVLFGRRGGERAATALYLLRTRARIPQDRSLLPTDGEMHAQAARGAADAILFLGRRGA